MAIACVSIPPNEWPTKYGTMNLIAFGLAFHCFNGLIDHHICVLRASDVSPASSIIPIPSFI
jgi:hypothetical protein